MKKEPKHKTLTPSRHVGVHWLKDSKKWRATIWIPEKGINHHIGVFSSKKEAIAKRNLTIAKLKKEGTELNLRVPRISEKTKKEIIEYFYAHQNNSCGAIAKVFNVSIGTVNWAVSTTFYYPSKKTLNERKHVSIAYSKAWKKEEKKKLIKALKDYNERCNDADKVNI